jgi:uncharacterized membrane protein
MKMSIKREISPIAMIILSIVLTLILYPGLPARIPVHFNLDGSPDRYAGKPSAVIVYLGSMVGLYLLLTFIPFIDPFKRRALKRYNAFLILRDFALAFLLFTYFVAISSAWGGRLSSKVLGIGIGLFMALMGNYLPKLPRNFFFGIRVPWTIASETVWRKTHILGGWLFVGGGLAIALLSLLGVNLFLSSLLILTPILLVSGFIYPLLLYRRLENREGFSP